MDTLVLLQHYWWLIISLLGALLVFLLFVQGGQAMLYTIGKTPTERDMIVNSLGRKWEITYTTLVTFGGAFFASFPLFYSTSFGGAVYVWMLILLVFVIQAVAYEYRRKPNNFLGEKTFEWFLMINGILGPLLLGTAVGTFFFGAQFSVDRLNIADFGGNTSISQWMTPWHGLDALADYRNLELGFSVMFLSVVLGLQYIINTVDEAFVRERAAKRLGIYGILFVIFFVAFLFSLVTATGYAVDTKTGVITSEQYKYLHNLLEMPYLAALLLLAVICVLWGLWIGWRKRSRKAIWFSGAGTVAAVLTLFLCAGWNNTSYYPSLTDAQSSLTIYNSSSSQFTLAVMSIVSILIPFVIAYIWYVWRSMNKKPITQEEVKGEKQLY